MGLLDFFRRSPAPAPAPGRDVLTRRFDAIGGRRWEGSAHFGNIGTETLAAGLPVQAKARYFVANNPWAAAAVNALVAGLVGPGIRAAGSPEATAAFDAWARVADADGRTDLWGLQAAAVRGMIVDGESFALIEETADGLRLRLLPAEQVDAAATMELPAEATASAESSSTRVGRRVAYHIFRQRPTDLFGTRPETVRVPAENMLHLCRPLGAGQVRGVSLARPGAAAAARAGHDRGRARQGRQRRGAARRLPDRHERHRRRAVRRAGRREPGAGHRPPAAGRLRHQVLAVRSRRSRPPSSSGTRFAPSPRASGCRRTL